MSDDRDRTGFEILEHTADVGLRAWGPDLPETFRQATLALLDITGAHCAEGDQAHDIYVEARDTAGALVEWLSEVLYIQDGLDRVVAHVSLRDVDETSARGTITTAARATSVEGTAVKAITLHQLSVVRTDDRWSATVFVDI